MIWPLVHILPGSSFLPGQRGKPTIHLLSSTVLLSPSAPCQIPKLFFLHQQNIHPRGLDFQNQRSSSLARPEAKPQLHPWHVQTGLGEESRWAGGGSPAEEGDSGAGRSRAATREPGAGAALARRCPEFCRVPSLGRDARSLLSLADPSGARPSLAGESVASRRSKAEPPSASRSRLRSFVFVAARSAPASPVPRRSGRRYSAPRSSQLLCRQKKRPCLMASFRLGFSASSSSSSSPSLDLILSHCYDLIGT